MNSRKADSQLNFCNILAILVGELVPQLDEFLQHVVRQLARRVGDSFLPEFDDRAHKGMCFFNSLVEFLDLGQALRKEGSQPGTHLLHGSLGFHHFESVVDGGVHVLFRAAELRADEDAAGYHGDDAGEFVVDVDFCPFRTWGYLEFEGLLNFLGN